MKVHNCRAPESGLVSIPRRVWPRGRVGFRRAAASQKPKALQWDPAFARLLQSGAFSHPHTSQPRIPSIHTPPKPDGPKRTAARSRSVGKNQYWMGGVRHQRTKEAPEVRKASYFYFRRQKNIRRSKGRSPDRQQARKLRDRSSQGTLRAMPRPRSVWQLGESDRPDYFRLTCPLPQVTALILVR